ncbi:MAG TPA: hypothetical protein VHN11_19410 [Xanthobacteraceae bacterium]|jgi:hypothetical protein|nr:hypothetical protein [Xanthobacteraceae bacterium]
MIHNKSLILTLLVVLSGSATPAESTTTATARIGNTSVFMSVPEGWEQQKFSVTYQGARPLFALAPTGSKPPEQDLAGSFYVLVAYFPKRGPISAQQRWGIDGPPMSELPRIYGLPEWSLFERRHDLSAFTPVGGDVLIIHVHVPDEANHARSKEMLMQIVKSYREDRAREPAP